MLVVESVVNIFGAQDIFADAIAFTDMVFGPASMNTRLGPAFVELLIFRAAWIPVVIQEDVCTHANQTAILHSVTMDQRELQIELVIQAIPTGKIDPIRAA
jgi:hypothetical protein